MNRYDKWVRNIGIVVFILMLITSFFLGDNMSGSSGSGPSQGSDIFKDAPVQRSTKAEAGELNVGDVFDLTITEGSGQVIKNFTVKLSWSDESTPPGRPRLRRYENQPDTFAIRVLQPDGNGTDKQGPNPMGDFGNLEIVIELDDVRLGQLYDQGIAGHGNWTVEVELVSAGMWTPVLGPGVLGLADNSNQFSLSVDYEYYNLMPGEGEE